MEALQLTAGIRVYPGTPLAATAFAEGRLAADDDLLQPRFYLARGLADWLPNRLRQWAGSRPYVVI